MNKFILGGLILFAVILSLAFQNSGQSLSDAEKEINIEKEKINWMTWEEAIDSTKTSPKKLFIDVYTDWCGWCKRMDATTFADPQVAAYINKHFYAVKFNAEQKEDIVYEGHTLKFQATGRRGFHELAYSLLDGRLGYPSYVYLDENRNRISISPGYKQVDPFLKELSYFAEGHYKTQSFQEFKEGSR